MFSLKQLLAICLGLSAIIFLNSIDINSHKQNNLSPQQASLPEPSLLPLTENKASLEYSSQNTLAEEIKTIAQKINYYSKEDNEDDVCEATFLIEEDSPEIRNNIQAVFDWVGKEKEVSKAQDQGMEAPQEIVEGTKDVVRSRIKEAERMIEEIEEKKEEAALSIEEMVQIQHYQQQIDYIDEMVKKLKRTMSLISTSNKIPLGMQCGDGTHPKEGIGHSFFAFCCSDCCLSCLPKCCYCGCCIPSCEVLCQCLYGSSAYLWDSVTGTCGCGN